MNSWWLLAANVPRQLTMPLLSKAMPYQVEWTGNRGYRVNKVSERLIVPVDGSADDEPIPYTTNQEDCRAHATTR